MTPRSTLRIQLASVFLTAMACFAMPAWGGYEALKSFAQPGSQPTGRLLRLASGESYGTATSGGAHGYGAVFRVTAAGVVELVVSFTGATGAAPGNGPTAGLVEGSDGQLYGTTSAGGANGFGVAFKISGTGVYTKLVEFTGTSGAAKGSVPGPLVAFTDGFLYGTTEAGGVNGLGTVFKISISGNLTTLAEFTGLTTGARRGAEPVGALALPLLGTTLYGVTRSGGASGLGTIYKITTAGVFTDIIDFTGTTGLRLGANPAGGLYLHSDGKYYGTTEFGGANGFGTLFSLTTLNGFTNLRSFVDASASQPVGELVASGNTLFGCCAAGGSSGLGGLFQCSTAGIYSLLTSFSGESGAAPGAVPRAGMVSAGAGFFQGCTSAGGPANLGTVFKLSSTGVFTTLANLSPDLGWRPSGAPVSDGAGGWLFPMAAGGSVGGGALVSRSAAGDLLAVAPIGGSLGDAPDGALVEKSGSYYGVSTRGGGSGRGTAFRYTPGIGTSLLNTFTSTNGSLAEGGLVIGSDGAFYGVGREGGAGAKGAVYKVTTSGVRTRLVSFTGTAGVAPGASPRGPFVFAPNLAFYGVTETGGASNTGVIYRISALGVYSLVAQFGTTGPRSPRGGLVLGSDGYLYGTTGLGGAADAGTLFRINPVNNSWSVVAEFDGTNAGTPGGELHAAADGAILGLASAGGPANAGAVFRFSGSGLWIVATFTGITGSTPGAAAADDGAGLLFAGGLTTDSSGTLYGTAAGGGAFGGGVLFRIVDDSPLALWKTANLGAPNAPDQADPDLDGLPNLIEYALGTDPNLPNPGPQANLATFANGKSLSLQIPRDPARTDITLIVEASSTLAPPWTPLATSINGGAFTGIGYVSGETAGSTPKSVLIRDTAITLSAPRRFLRLRVVH